MESRRKLFYHLQLSVIVLAVSWRATFEHSTHGIKCLGKEKQALLRFKDRVIDEDGQLSSWGNAKDKKECCKWEGVHCDNQTNHIIGLNFYAGFLSGSNISFSILLLQIPHLKYVHLGPQELFNYAQISQFIDSRDRLQYLDLSSNGLSSFSLIFPLLLNFDLTYLDLSDNMLQGPIPNAIGNLSSLRYLSLSDNQLEGKVPISLGNLSRLEYLDLSVKDLIGTIPHLNGTSLRGPIPNAIGNLSSLRYLSLSGCQLEGGVPISLGNLSKLEYLDLSFNKFTGTIPHLAQSSSLVELHLDENMFNGTVTQIFTSLYKVERLSLHSNNFEDMVTCSHFSNLSKLRTLDMSSNNGISFNFSSEWNPPFQLTVLRLADCKIGPRLPTWLITQKELEVLVIANAGISDTSDWFWDWEPSPDFKFLNVSYNNFRGALPDLSSKFPSIYFLDLSFNHFTGPLPNLPPQGDLYLSNNEFSGSIITKICNESIPRVFILDLSNNQLSGPLPDCFANQTSLELLVLAHNNFSGKIPALNIDISALHLQNNSFTGEIPTSLRNCTELDVLDLSQNKLTGIIPTWVGDTWTKLIFLNLRANEFFGSIPPNLCHLVNLHVLDFSLNKISGNIPKCLNNLTAMGQGFNERENWKGMALEEIGTAYLMWKGNELLFIAKVIDQVTLIDLSSNNLVGIVPPEITSLVGLIGLNLSRNNLSGFIPPKIGEIKLLNFLDLSRNHFSGNIPNGVSQLDRLGKLDLSYNNLSGRIPQSNHMQTFDDSSFEGNPNLCGIPLVQKPCPRDEIARDPKINIDSVDRLKKEDDNFINDGFYVSMGIGFVVGLWGVWVTLVFNNSLRIALFRSWNTVMDWLYVKTIISKRRVKEAFYKFVRF